MLRYIRGVYKTIHAKEISQPWVVGIISVEVQKGCWACYLALIHEKVIF